MQNNAYSHSVMLNITHFAKKGFKDIRLMEQLPASLDINPIVNLWIIIKIEVYENGKQHSSKDLPWKAIKTAANDVKVETIEK